MINFFQQISEAWSTWMLAAGWQAALLAGFVFVLLLLLRRWISAPLRYAILLVVLLKFATPPFLTLSTGFFSQSSAMHQQVVRVPPIYSVETTLLTEDNSSSAVRGRVRNSESAENIQAQETIPQPGASPAPVVPNHSATAKFSWSAFWLCLYVGGVVCALVVLMRRYTAVRRIVRSSALQESGTLHAEIARIAGLLNMKTTPALRLSDETDGPFAIGTWHPTIVLPRGLAEELQADQLTIVLAHELAHIRRRDLLLGWFETLVSIVWWFHPALWWLRRSLRQTREDCCDDLLLARELAQPERYCETLIEAATRQHSRLAEPLVLGFVHREHPTARRIRRLMDASLFRSDRLRYPALFLVVLIALIMLPGIQPEKQPVNSTTLEGIGGWRNLAFQLDKKEEAVIEECKQLSQTYFHLRSDKRVFNDPETRDKLTAILKQNPQCFYAQYLLGTWYRLQGNREEAQRLIQQSLEKAPVVLTQTYKLGTEKPAAGIEIPAISIECNRVKDHYLDPSLKLQYVGLITDANGTVQLPVFDTVFRTSSQSYPEGYQAEFQNLGWFESKSRQGTLPDVLVWKTWSRPRDFTRTAAESNWLKDAAGTRSLELDLDENRYAIGSVSRGQADGTFLSEDGKGHSVKSTSGPLPELSNAAYMDHALIELVSPAESQFDLEQVNVLDSQTKVPLRSFQYGAGFTWDDPRRFHLFSLWERLPKTIDLVLKVYNYEADHFRYKLPAQVGATIQHAGATLEIKYLESGNHLGWSSNKGFYGEAQNKRNTSETIIDLVQGEGFHATLWVVSKSGRRIKLDRGGWSSGNVGTPPIRIMLPLGEIDHFELLPNVAAQTIYFEQLQLPTRETPLDQQVPEIVFPVKGQARKFTSHVLSPLLIHFESLRGNLYSGMSSSAQTFEFQERAPADQNPEFQSTISWYYYANVELKHRIDVVATDDARNSSGSGSNCSSGWGDAGYRIRKLPLEQIDSVRMKTLSQPAD
ncbi:M56 family metallopeptidase [Gimesia chilikensis]|uniref:Methicillin resistance mecR1 protein n=1 Tax=Gimesia chilikensis TaxID=2605989 RepID=A0A517PRV2_9PLAN|nr:M56 family metallopeptidase [Gimesia chilikensis]QDT22105.1 Methicillin resistance mecR1 protein [Gimesia chilikensis]